MTKNEKTLYLNNRPADWDKLPDYVKTASSADEVKNCVTVLIVKQTKNSIVIKDLRYIVEGFDEKK